MAEEAGEQGAFLAGRKILKLPCHKGFRANTVVPKIKNIYFETQYAKNNASLFQAPAFMYGALSPGITAPFPLL